MSCLEATFTLTPLSPYFVDPSLNSVAYFTCYGGYFANGGQSTLSSLYLSNRFFFHNLHAR